MISKTQQYLCMFCLVGSATTVSGIQLDRSAETVTTTPTKTECFLEPHEQHQTGSVTFTHGDVSDQHGQRIEAGSLLAIGELITVKSDGFLSIHLEDGQTLNIQPNTSTSIACALTAQPSDLDVDQPYRVGAIRG